MANLPVESMSTGGVLWLPDLTVTDYFYGLPLLTSLTFLLTIEVGSFLRLFFNSKKNCLVFLISLHNYAFMKKVNDHTKVIFGIMYQTKSLYFIYVNFLIFFCSS